MSTIIHVPCELDSKDEHVTIAPSVIDAALQAVLEYRGNIEEYNSLMKEHEELAQGNMPSEWWDRLEKLDETIEEDVKKIVLAQFDDPVLDDFIDSEGGLVYYLVNSDYEGHGKVMHAQWFEDFRY